jgi:hypothetical protein
MEAVIQLNEENLRRTALRHEFGRVSGNELRSAEQTLLQSQMNREALEMNRAMEVRALNRILQKDPEAAVTVSFEREFSPVPEDLSQYITSKVGNEPVVTRRRLATNGTEPSIVQRQLTLATKKIEQDANEDENRQQSFDNEFDKALRDLNDARRAMDSAIRTGHQNMEQLLKRQEALLIDLEKAENQWHNINAHLNRGMVTQFEADQAALAILNIEISIEKNWNQLWLLDFMFQHPFLLG